MLIVEKLSDASPRTEVSNSLAVDTCLALDVRTLDPRSQTLTALADLPDWATDLRARADRLLPGWPNLLIDSIFRTSYGSDFTIFDANENAHVVDDMTAAYQRINGEAADQARLTERCAEVLIIARRIVPAAAYSSIAPVRTADRYRRNSASEHLATLLLDKPIRALASISPRIFHDPDNDRLVLADHGQGIDVVDATDLSTVTVIPSRFVGHGLSITRAEDRLGIVVPPPHHPLDVASDVTRIEAGVRALGNEHGLRIVMLCLRKPHTTSELGSLMHLTPAPVSRQLKRLECAGLITARRRGRYVDYLTTIEGCDLLGRNISRLPEQVNRATADEALRRHSSRASPSPTAD
nr:winged helix-turn-helix domain-containing protein [Rhodococcus sp. (in: high G+C Gram-positive bacteria)]